MGVPSTTEVLLDHEGLYSNDLEPYAERYVEQHSIRIDLRSISAFPASVARARTGQPGGLGNQFLGWPVGWATPGACLFLPPSPPLASSKIGAKNIDKLEDIYQNKPNPK